MKDETSHQEKKERRGIKYYYTLLLPYIKLILLALSMAFVFEHLGWFGVGGYLLLILGFGLYRCWIMRKEIQLAIDSLAIAIWGKPLRKEFWKKGELRNTKVKIIWGRKNDKRNQRQKKS